MKKITLLSLIMLLTIASTSFATSGAEIGIKINQFDSENNKHLIFSDTITINDKNRTIGFIGPFSADIELLYSDSSFINFNIHLITLATNANNYSKSFSVEYGLPAHIDEIVGKNGTRYQLQLTPLSFVNSFINNCQYNHLDSSQFMVTPSGHLDIYYIPSSYADFFVSATKDLLEKDYRRFKNFLNLNLPGKMQIYLSPCLSNSVIWDYNYGISVDPTHNTAFAIINHDINTAYPFIVNHTALLRTYGYSSSFLSDGLANYFSISIFEMKKLLKEKFALKDFLKSYDYRNADPKLADRISTTFTRFLIDSYTLDRFLELYKKSDDINLSSELEKIYNLSVEELENNWRHYVDTIQIHPQKFYNYALMAETMIDYELMHEYNLELIGRSNSKKDSIMSFGQIKRSSFFLGDYENAYKYQKLQLNLSQENVKGWMALGSYAMMMGNSNEALEFYTKAKKLDSANQMINFNIARYYITKNENQKAIDILENNFSKGKKASAQGESKILLAGLLAQSKNDKDIERAKKLYRESINIYNQALAQNGSAPSSYMWLGISQLGIDEVDDAIGNMQVAKFIESRPFYLGMIDLWLGKAYLRNNNFQLSKDHLNSVINNKSAEYHKREAKQILKSIK